MRRGLIFLAVMLCGFLETGYAQSRKLDQEKIRGSQMSDLCMKPVGVVKKQGEQAWLEIFPAYAPALKGIQDFSHIWVFYWFHGNDRPEERATLQVHPRRNPANPLTGVFATRSPARPNLIGLTACRLVKVEGNVLEVADLDAQDGSPILDLKPYIPEGDSIPGARTPAWVRHLHRSE
jgi:tRNA-Thr(GGU) m(6)t(6)A37 methyltransferase TsaA